MAIVVRRAKPTDLDWLMIQLKAFSRFFGSRKPLFGDEDYSRRTMASMMELHLVLVAEREDGELLGFIGGLVTPHFMNPKISLLAEVFWWVDEAHRHSRAALMLLEQFVQWGKANVDWITLSLEDVSPVSDRCFTKRGFRLKEKSYILEVS